MELVNKQSIVIDFYKSHMIPTYTFYQHDNNQIEFVIETNGATADLSKVSRVLLNIKRPDGKVVSRELDKNGNVILYRMQHEEMKASGFASLTLQFYNSDAERLSTAKIKVYFASTVEANVEFKDKQGTLYQQIIMEMDGLKEQLYTLNKLTEEKGETAESKGNFAEEKAQEAIEAAELAAEEAANLSQLKTDVTGATEAASTAAEAARTNANHAKTQGDYAKEQADVAAQRTEELNGLEVSQFYDRQEEFSRQLADKANKNEVNNIAAIKADKSFVDTNISALDTKINRQASGAPKGVYATLSDLQAAFPTGNTNVYIVSSDGKWYYWNGTAWTSGGIYQATASDILPASNRAANGDFASGTTKWTTNHGTTSFANNIATLTGNGTNISPHIIQNVGARDVTHKYYSRASVRAITEGIQALQLFNSVTHQLLNPVLNQWYDIEGISTPPTTNNYLGVYLKTADAASSLNKKIEIKYVLEIDLTATFGEGKEPTIEEIRQLLSRFPNKWFEGTASFFDGRRVYSEIEHLKNKKITGSDLTKGIITSEKIAEESVTLSHVSFSEKTKNKFNGTYEKIWLYGSLDKPHIVKNETRRTAIVPIDPNKSYSISVYGAKDAFRIATSVNLPTYNADGTFFPDRFLHFNDVGRQFSFTNNGTDKYLYVMVSQNSHEPLMQVEEGKVVTDYVPHKVLKPSLLPKIKKEDDVLLPSFTNTELVSNNAGPRFIDYFDGKLWGYRFDGGFYYSTDEGRNWTPHSISWNHTDWGWVQRLVPTNDGEVIAVSEKHIRKSSGWNTETVTWSENKVTPNTNCVFPIFGFDGDGTKFIAVEYANGNANWKHSRFVHVSVDSGDTWTNVFDSLARHGEELNNITHLHAGCYDRWADRFYFSEGHSPAGGLFYSEDNGASWHQAKGHRDGVLYSQGIVDKVGDTNGPTVIVATDKGLVMGSDNQNNGVFGLIRKDNPQDEVVEWIYQTSYERKGVQMFAQRGWRDPKSGTVYITFRSEWDDVPPIIVAATPTHAKLAYEYPTLPVRGGADRFMAIAKTSDNRIVANSEFAGVPHTFRAELTYPNTEISNLIRIELKKLGLI